MSIPPAPPVLVQTPREDAVNQEEIPYHPPLEDPPRNWSDVAYHQYLFEKAIEMANEANVSVTKQIERAAMVAEDCLDYDSLETPQAREVLLCQQVLHKRLYTNQVLRKVTKHHILSAEEAARGTPELQHMLDAVEYQRLRLLASLPPKRCILKPDNVRSRCMDILSDLYEVSQEMLQVGQATYHDQQCRGGSPHRL